VALNLPNTLFGIDVLCGIATFLNCGKEVRDNYFSSSPSLTAVQGGADAASENRRSLVNGGTA
jgi:hypothetical protein